MIPRKIEEGELAPGINGRPVVYTAEGCFDLPAVVTPQGVAITSWELEPEERAALLAGVPFYLVVHGKPLRPVCPKVGAPTAEEVKAL